MWQTRRSGHELGRVALPGTKAAQIVPGGFPSTQSLPVWKKLLDIFDGLHTAGERVKWLDCQGEKGRAQTSQTKKGKIKEEKKASIRWPPLPPCSYTLSTIPVASSRRSGRNHS